MDYKQMQNMLTELKNTDVLKKQLAAEIKSLKTECESLMDCKSPMLDGMPKGGMIWDNVGNKVIKIVDIYEKRINKLMDETKRFSDNRFKLENIIKTLNEDERDVINAKYVLGLKWDYIPAKVCMSRAKCFYVHKAAINKLISLWDENVH